MGTHHEAGRDAIVPCPKCTTGFRMQYVIFASYGNDSIALIQWAFMEGLQDVTVAFNETGWARFDWDARIQKAEQWIATIGFHAVRIPSEGMEALVRRKKAWPRGGGGKYQFCTKSLKQEPACRWLDQIDPKKELTCMVGIRREESLNRQYFPEWTESSDHHGGRSLWAPLVRFTARERDLLLSQTPFLPLPYRSKECFPCVNARKEELASLDDGVVHRIHQLEVEMGMNSKGNPRVMFSPKRHKGATGIQEVVQWARQEKKELPLFACDGGYCDP